MLIQGVELGFVNIPHHVLNLKSDFVCESVTVDVRPTLPTEGASMLLGNDLSGDKVVVNPIVSDKPCFEDDCDISPACSVTRCMKLSEEETADIEDNLNMVAEIFEENETTIHEDKYPRLQFRCAE